MCLGSAIRGVATRKEAGYWIDDLGAHLEADPSFPSGPEIPPRLKSKLTCKNDGEQSGRKSEDVDFASWQ